MSEKSDFLSQRDCYVDVEKQDSIALPLLTQCCVKMDPVIQNLTRCELHFMMRFHSTEGSRITGTHHQLGKVYDKTECD